MSGREGSLSAFLFDGVIAVFAFTVSAMWVWVCQAVDAPILVAGLGAAMFAVLGAHASIGAASHWGADA